MDELLNPWELLRIIWRRKWFMSLPAALILTGAIIYLSILPPQYQSKATIFVEDQEIPEDLVPSLTTDYIDRRLNMLTRRVLLSDTLIQLSERYDLYPKMREKLPARAVAEKMRDDINIGVLSAEVTDPRSGRSGDMTVAFEVRFTYGDPDTARRVTNELVSLFLATNLEVRRSAAQQTTSFLANERTAVERRITRIEDDLADFKTENRLLLPDEVEFSRQRLANLEQQLNVIDRDLRALKEREGFLTTQLALTDEFETEPLGRGVTPESQLENLRAELATARARYSASHPDVIRLRREVGSLEAVVGDRAGGGGALREQESALVAELGVLRQRYGAEHPDVVRAERQLSSVRSALANSNSGSEAGSGLRPNPAYVQLRAQVNSVQTELQSVEQQRTELLEARTELQSRLSRAPAVEREYTRLQRELENAIADREVIADKEATAQLGLALETEAVGERLKLAEPPTLPLSPITPNKKLILAVGLVLAMGGGGAGVLLAELFDRSVRSANDLVRIIGEKPLIAIPVLATAQDWRRKWIKGLGGTALLVLLCVGGVLWADRAVGPLDVLRFEMQNRIETWWTGIFATAETPTQEG